MKEGASFYVDELQTEVRVGAEMVASYWRATLSIVRPDQVDRAYYSNFHFTASDAAIDWAERAITKTEWRGLTLLFRGLSDAR